jgi:probable rRNA maturation factor
VVISYPQAVIQAGERGHSVKRELTILTIHGILHLLGYDHAKPEERRRMRSREAALLKSVDGELDEC